MIQSTCCAGGGALTAFLSCHSCSLGASDSGILHTSAYSTAAQARPIDRKSLSVEYGSVNLLLPAPSNQVYMCSTLTLHHAMSSTALFPFNNLCQVCTVEIVQVRHMASIQPEDTVYSGPQAPSPKRVTLRSIRSKYSKGKPISMVTAYDYPSAVHVRLQPSDRNILLLALTPVSLATAEQLLSN